MCDVATAAMIALQAASAGMGAMQQNAQSAQNRASAIGSMNVEIATEQKQHEQSSRAAVQEAYDLALEGRANEATFLNFAADGGAQGISVNEGLFAVKNVGGRQSARFLEDQKNRIAQTALNLKGIQATAANRINSVPRESVIGAALGGAVAGAGKAFADGKLDNIIKPRATPTNSGPNSLYFPGGA